MKSSKQRSFTISLFIVYFIALIWIVLFKLTFNFLELDHFRNINLIPFTGSVITNGKYFLNEIALNVIAFVPFGIYISMIKQEWSFIKKIAPCFITSLVFEILQFILMIGASDITDLIGNTLGGCIGIGAFYLFYKLAKDRTIKVINILAFIVTIIMIVFIAFLLIVNM